MCPYFQNSPARLLATCRDCRRCHDPGTITANHAKYTKRIRAFRVVRAQKIRPSNSTCSRRRTKSVSHGRQSKILCSGPSLSEDYEDLRPAKTFRKETLASPHPLTFDAASCNPGMQITWSEARRRCSTNRRLPPLHSRLSAFLFFKFRARRLV